ncbi:ribonuclease toxin HepT-like protein [Thermoflexus hugenholtzii]
MCRRSGPISAGFTAPFGRPLTISGIPKRPSWLAINLHNLYNVCENIFRRIAEAFENEIPDLSRWHALLLERMGREIEGIRPRVLCEEALRLLDELRRFRHVFCTLYRFDLDPERVARVREDAFRLEPLLEADLQEFLDFLSRMSAEAS